MKVAEYLVAQMDAWGVERVYGLPGDTILDLIDALHRAGRPRFIPVHHEQAAAFMASAEAKLTGHPACCLATAGPGATNLLTGVADADVDRAPVVVITGQVPRRRMGDEGQHLDQPRLFSAVAGYSEVLAAPEALPRILPLAWRVMLSQGRAVHLSVPQDLWQQPLEAPVRGPEPFLGAHPSSSPEMVSQAAALLRQAARPVIVAGLGARWARQDLLELAERWQAPIVRSMGGIGAVPASHPLVVGGFGEGGSGAAHELLRQADVALVVGATWWPEEYVPQHLRIVQLDRWPANVGRNAEVAYGLLGDAAELVPVLARAVAPAERPGWLAEVERLRRRWHERLADLARPDGMPLPPGLLVRELERALPRDAAVVLDVGDHVLWFNAFFGGDAHHVLLSGTWRSMGFALPAALAAKLAQPERTVVALVGDGGLGMLVGELPTAVRLGTAVAVVVANNGMLAMERNKMARRGLEPFGTDLANPDFVRLAEACGVRAWRVQDPASLPPVLGEALGAGIPALVDVPVAASPPPEPVL